ncbi:MAG: DUF4364 family protein [Firmicutes bacterium]|nr:DUF4364 family protein [Bacillota bacterium]MCL1953854.1 DUF4364 family protein [Bacillota bacterium]
MQEKDTTNKLILLFIFDKLDMPVTDTTLIDLVTSSNEWLSFLDFQISLSDLVESNFLYRSVQDTSVYYSITPNGRMCVSHFYNKIPSSLQVEISEYIKQNRMALRRNQEYYRHYSKNPDGTFTVILKIVDPVQTTLEIKINAPTDVSAKLAYSRWTEKAARTYFWLHEQLLDEDT